MSADNWRICPQCLARLRAKRAAQKQKADDAYGKVSIDEYLALRAKSELPVDLEETFREDYQLGVYEDGMFIVGYSGYCQKCGFKKDFSHKEQLQVSATKEPTR